jgi:hypothetical protein
MKTYKTARGLNNALKKALGNPSVSHSSGNMSDGYMMFPVKDKDTYRVIMIRNGFPEKFIPYEDSSDFPEWTMELARDFGGTVEATQMFDGTSAYVDITLEVSK